MEDAVIVDLYWQRQERALDETKTKYGTYCHAIAWQILNDDHDADECENDTYLGAWNAMPPHRPACLKTFLGKITRNLSLKRWRARTATKRGSGEVALSLDELEECVPARGGVEDPLELEELVAALNRFLAELSSDARRMFICRYWYVDSIGSIAQRFGFSESKVKMTLKRTRDDLARYLQEEGIIL